MIIKSNYKERLIPLLTMLVWLSLLVLLPKEELSYDSYDYAAQIKHGIHLFSPHHLLHNAFWWLVLIPFRALFPQLEVLSMLQLGNSIIAFAILLVLYHFIKAFGRPTQEALWLTLLTAGCHCMVYFASENEAYLIPLLLSLTGTYFFWNYLKVGKPSNLIIAGFFLALACLFHQLHFWWWLAAGLALVIHKAKRTAIIAWLGMACMVPVVYVAVWWSASQGLGGTSAFLGFVFHDFLQGHTQSPMDWKVLPMFFISLIRTFLQVHPTQWVLVQQSWFYLLPALLSLCFVFWAFWRGVLTGSGRQRSEPERVLTQALVGALMLHGFFALYARGNSEFMVMFPVLLTLLFAIHIRCRLQLVQGLAAALLLWNSTYDLWLHHRFRIWGHQSVVEAMILHPKEVFILNRSEALTLAFYHTGIDNPSYWIYRDKVDERSLDSILTARGRFYTDVPNSARLPDRGSFFNQPRDVPWNHFRMQKLYQGNVLVGEWALYRVEGRR